MKGWGVATADVDQAFEAAQSSKVLAAAFALVVRYYNIFSTMYITVTRAHRAGAGTVH